MEVLEDVVKSCYIHIPFCNKICSYCDFCKVLYDKRFISKYLDSLEKEVNTLYKGEELETLYIGGGVGSVGMNFNHSFFDSHGLPLILNVLVFCHFDRLVWIG